nr:MAG TPA: hypothetical protein [Caudoviricetes sp.]
MRNIAKKFKMTMSLIDIADLINITNQVKYEWGIIHSLFFSRNIQALL